MTSLAVTWLVGWLVRWDRDRDRWVRDGSRWGRWVRDRIRVS